MRHDFAIVVLMLLPIASASAQKPTSENVSERKTSSVGLLPVYEFALSEPDDYPAIAWPKNEHIVEAQCNGDGNVFVWKPALGLVGLTPKGAVLFSKDMLSDIPHPSVTFTAADLAVSDAGVFFRVSGYEDKDIEKRGDVNTEWVIHSQQFIAHFDKDGHYVGAIKDLPFVIFRLGSFNSGNLIAQGQDNDHRARLALLNSEGLPLAYLQLPKDLTENPEPLPTGVFAPCPDCDSNSLSDMLSSSFTPARGRMILFRAGVGSTRAYEIQESGEVRVINIKLPQGFTMRHFIPSDRNWVAKSANADSQRGESLFEIDPENGEVLREYRLPDAETEPACFAAGELWGVRRDTKEEKLRVVHGASQPHRDK